MKASDDKMRKTDCVSTEQLLRIIQSIPSKKAEPFKQWLALVGKEHLDEIADPELAFERMIDTYRKSCRRNESFRSCLVVSKHKPLHRSSNGPGNKFPGSFCRQSTAAVCFSSASGHLALGMCMPHIKNFF